MVQGYFQRHYYLNDLGIIFIRLFFKIDVHEFEKEMYLKNSLDISSIKSYLKEWN